jgi:hypothetical protein
MTNSRTQSRLRKNKRDAKDRVQEFVNSYSGEGLGASDPQVMMDDVEELLEALAVLGFYPELGDED